ncbi:lipoprotein insertase outer membrane protein LolB [Thiohalomonas denitrificans]|uniref:Outer-membrane lipoprotein LolB n=1 Tax=Thiohalomonas denitrificans TaxID=415747 RepID=A0A1G5Q8L1_9GAMM|nr:lipoprotein insertase outer membrane protein LolB [Thiohalomonas denitrificans]SCZ57906.1 outer membrane lipoprotein LolB [Thiohalomonas denitrificans]
MIRISGILAVALLTGCAALAPEPPVADPEQAWAIHRDRLETIDNWGLNGRLAIQSDGEAWHATLNWRQEDSRYAMRITAPLGQGSLRLEGSPRFVQLQTSKGERAVSDDPEQLLYQQLGWPVPVASLRYWVLGLPAPGAAQRELDSQGRLARLQQDGWSIRFMDYRQQDGAEVPTRVFASRGDAEVRLVIGNWTLPSPAGAG